MSIWCHWANTASTHSSTIGNLNRIWQPHVCCSLCTWLYTWLNYGNTLMNWDALNSSPTTVDCRFCFHFLYGGEACSGHMWIVLLWTTKYGFILQRKQSLKGCQNLPFFLDRWHTVDDCHIALETHYASFELTRGWDHAEKWAEVQLQLPFQSNFIF